MKTEIIPTILVNSFKEVEEKIKAVEKYVSWVQLDIMDGVFVNNETWPHSVVPGVAKRGKKYSQEIEKLKKLKTKVKIEAHLMVQNPEEEFDDWLKVADRVIIHFESKITNRELGVRELIKKAQKKKKGFGLALNPETHYAVATPFLKDLDLVLLMTVQPGWGGQEMKSWVLEKAEALRKIWPKGNIEVDGGVNNENIGEIKKSGVNLICAGTYIYRSGDIGEAIKDLSK
jgi:ribulose-phosphate 3-epimerase